MRKIYIVLAIGLLAFTPANFFNNTVQTLPFTQNWTSTGLITANDNWSGVPGIEGYLGQDITTVTGTDPQTLLGVSGVANDLDVIANQTNPNTNSSGGVGEFDGIANPTIALQGSGTGDAPYVIFYLNTTSLQNINIAYNIRDIDGSTDNAVQPVALQYRVGNSGNFTNLPAGFVADATTGPSLATLVTAVSTGLPAACNNQAEVQVRVITANAVGNDEWVGIDDINITGSPLSGNSSNSNIALNGAFSAQANINYLNFQSADITNANSVEIAQFNIQDGGGAADGDAVATILTNLSLSVTNSANIRRIALYDGTTELGEVAGGATANFSSLTLTAPDNGTKTFSVRVTYNTAVTDNQQSLFTITSATADGAGSNFAAANAGGAASSIAGDDNRIEVTADRLAFVQNVTSPTGVNTAMVPAVTISTNDINSNRDLDIISNIDITSTGTLTGTTVTVAAVEGFATFSTLTHTVAGTGFQLTAASTGLTSINSNLFDIQVATLATDYFRSKDPSGGNWGDLSSWESSPDNNTWYSATLIPTATANTITIRNGHTITVAAAAGGDQITVDAGGTLVLNANFVLADGADPVDMTVNGTVINTSGTHTLTGASSFSANSLYQHNRNGSPILTASWNQNSTVEIIGVGGTAPTGLGQTFGNFTWNCPSQSSNIGLGNPAGFAIAGNLTVTSTGGVTNRAFRFTAGTAYTLSVGGNLILNGGHLGLSSAAGSMVLTIAGNVILSNNSELYLSQGGSALGTINIGGNLSVSSATITETGSSNGLLVFNKNGTQTFSATSAILSNTLNYTVNNVSTLVLNNSLPLNTGTALVVDGILDCGLVSITGAGTVTINGTLKSSNSNGIGTTGTLATSGTTTLGSASIIEFNTAGAQVFDGRSDYANVVINGGGDKTLNANATLSANLSLTNGKVILGNNNLIVGGAVNGGSSANYVITNGTGALTIKNIGTVNAVFPVGPSGTLYHPVTINNAGTADDFSVNLSSASAPACLPSSNSVTETWNISEGTPGGSNCTLTFDYTGAAEGASYTSSGAQIAHCAGASVDYHNGSVTGSVATGSGFTSFSPFGITVDNVVLPVKFGNVKAYQQGTAINVEWSNLTETNVADYKVERSADGQSFSVLGAVSPRSNNGGRADYTYLDANPVNGVNFYRIQSLEQDGKKLYSVIVRVSTKGGKTEITVYPNPATGNQVSFQATSLPKGQYTLRIIGTNGQRVYSQSLVHAGGAVTATLQLPATVAPGIYNLQLAGTTLKLTKTIILQ